MPYTDEGVYRYEVEVPGSGDSLRKAAMQMGHDIEAYLFDHNAPGYDNKAFLSWALAHFLGTHQSSGTQVNRQTQWDPSIAGEDQRETHNNEGKNHASWTSTSAIQNGIRYPADAFDDPKINTGKNVKGESELYASNEVTNPAHASETNENAVVVSPRSHAPEKKGSK